MKDSNPIIGDKKYVELTCIKNQSTESSVR